MTAPSLGLTVKHLFPVEAERPIRSIPALQKQRCCKIGETARDARMVANSPVMFFGRVRVFVIETKYGL
jgi:hypothetical protein